MNRQSLLNLITPLAPAVTRITGGHIRLRGDGMMLSAIAVGEQFSIATSGPSAIVIDTCPDYATLKAALSGMTGETITITTGDGSLTLSGRGRRTVRCLPPDTFPSLDLEPGQPTAIDGDALREALQFVARAASDDQSKPMLHGVHINGGDVVAIDGTSKLRIIEMRHSLSQATIPSGAVAALSKLLAGPTTAAIGRRATFSGDGYTFSTTLINQPFPPIYRKVIPDGDGSVLVVDAEEAARAVNAVASFADSKTKRVFLSMAAGDVSLSCDAAIEPLDVYSWDGGEHKVLFNGALMADTLTAFGKGKVEIVFKADKESPLLFRDSAGRKAVVMPMRF